MEKKINVQSIFKQIKVCESVFFEYTEGLYIPPYAIHKLEYKNHNLDTCSVCKSTYDKIIKEYTSYYAKFPLCCEHHRKLINYPQYRRSDFDNTVLWLAEKSMAVHHHIIDRLPNNDWYDDITSFIKYVILSFGSIPFNFGGPVSIGQFFLIILDLQNDLYSKGEAELKYKQLQIVNFIKKYLTPSTNDSRDFSLILGIYDSWFNSFPFHLEFFSHLKNDFKKIFPIVKGETLYNRYTGQHGFTLKSSYELVHDLDKITNKLLESIDTTSLLENDYITNSSKYKIDLIKSKHKIIQLEVVKKFQKGELRYVNTIKKWLSNEQRFLKDLSLDLRQVPKEANTITTFEELLNENKQTYYLEILEELSITKNGVSILPDRKKSALRGVNEALRESNFLPELSLEHLNKITAKKIGLELKSKLDHSKTCKDFIKSTKIYLTAHPFIK